MADLFNAWDDKECKAAWEKFRKDHSPIELLHMFYGGLLKGEIELDGFIAGLNQHDKAPSIIDFDFTNPVGEENTFAFEQRIPLEDIKYLAETYQIKEDELEHYRQIYPDSELNSVFARFWLKVKSE